MEDHDVVKVEKLQEASQFLMWKFQMKVYLNASEIFNVVCGDFIKPEEDSKDFEKNKKLWTKADCRAQRIIVSSIGPQPMQHIMNCSTSREMWTKLESVYEQKSKTNIHLLQQKFYSYTRDPKDGMATFISKLETIVKQLTDLGEEISSSMIITKILMTLPAEYSHFYSAWESTAEEQRTLDNLTTRLIMEEARVQSQESSEFSGALMAKRFSADFKKKGHSSKKPGKCYACGKIGHWKRDCPNRAKKSEQLKCGDAFVIDETEPLECTETQNLDVWFLDSGASHHMSNRREWFINYKKLKQLIAVRVGNGETIYAEGRGDINVLAYNNENWVERHIADVLYLPKIHLNLFSSNCAMDKGLKLQSDHSKCVLLKGESIVAVGVRKNKLFELQFKVIPVQNSEVSMNSAVKLSTLQLWHERLGHQNLNQVKIFLRNRNIKFTEENVKQVCRGCALGKQHRASFGISESKPSAPGELIHSDVCGPMQKASI